MPHKINEHVCHAHLVFHVRAVNESSIHSDGAVLNRHDGERFSTGVMVRGYHVYKDVWSAIAQFKVTSLHVALGSRPHTIISDV